MKNSFKSKMKNFFKSKWTKGLVFGLIISIIRDILEDLPLLSTLVSLFNYLWKVLLFALTYEIKVWHLLLFGLVGVVFFIYFIKWKFQDTTPAFTEIYTEDTLKKLKWSWEWELSYDNEWDIHNLRAHCSECDTILVQSSCPRLRCDFEVGPGSGYPYEKKRRN